MKINIISDVHIKEQYDDNAKLLFEFFNKSQSKDVVEIILLGDIFDLLVGNHSLNSTRYNLIFIEIRNLLLAGKTIWYFEGNHDLHLSKFFKKEFAEHWNKNFKLIKNFIELKRFDKKIYITHGDYLTYHEPNYQKYRKFASWRIVEFLFENIVSYSLIKNTGDYFSNRSKKIGKKVFDYQRAQEGFRRGAEKICETHNNLNYLIAGHSHIKDEFLLTSGGLYLNNGYAPKEKTFLQLSEEGHQFINL